MSDSADAICQEMAAVRQALHEELETLRDSGREIADWRQHVRRHPWWCLGIAGAVGYLLVPKKRVTIRPDKDALLALANNKKVLIQGGATSKPLLSGLLRAATVWAVRIGIGRIAAYHRQSRADAASIPERVRVD